VALPADEINNSPKAVQILLGNIQKNLKIGMSNLKQTLPTLLQCSYTRQTLLTISRNVWPAKIGTVNALVIGTTVGFGKGGATP